MAASILALSVAAITQSVVTGQQQTYEALHDLRAVSLAESLLEEIMALPYADPDGASAAGPDAGEAARADFDNADDFHGYSEPLGLTTDIAGQAYPSTFARFGRDVTATYTTADSLGQTRPGLLVVITVTDERDRMWTVQRFIVEPTP